jgi:hypothetical protein
MENNTIGLAEILSGFIRDEHYFILGEGLIAFYYKDAADLINAGMQLTEAVTEPDDLNSLLKGVSVYYFSKEQHSGFVDSATLLNKFFGTTSIKDTVDYMHLSDAISYQMNVSAKCLRIAKHIEHSASKIKDKPYRVGLSYLMAAMLRKFSAQAADNCQYIYNQLGTDVSTYHFWYETIRDKMADSVNRWWLVDRIDAFFKQRIFYPLAKDIAWQKKAEEDARASHAVKVLISKLNGNPPVSF